MAEHEVMTNYNKVTNINQKGGQCSSAVGNTAVSSDFPNTIHTVVPKLFVPCTLFTPFFLYLQCFDTVGWMAGRASGL